MTPAGHIPPAHTDLKKTTLLSFLTVVSHACYFSFEIVTISGGPSSGA
jgi:hypothetical protein